MGIEFDLEKCTGCGNCVPACPFGLLEIVDDKVRMKEGCTLCGACRDVCAFDAVTIETEDAPVDTSAFEEFRGVWVFVDFLLALFGAMKDDKGRPVKNW